MEPLNEPKPIPPTFQEATLQHEAGNAFNYKLGKILEKYGVSKGLMLYHPGGKAFNDVEIVMIGNPHIDWICDTCENLCAEIEARQKAGKIASGVAGMKQPGMN